MSRTRKTTLANLVLKLSPLPKTYLVYMRSSCPAHNSLNIWNIFMKLHRWPNHMETICREQKKKNLANLVFEFNPFAKNPCRVKLKICVQLITLKPYRIYL